MTNRAKTCQLDVVLYKYASRRGLEGTEQLYSEFQVKQTKSLENIRRGGSASSLARIHLVTARETGGRETIITRI